jgi:hypothetical protein
MTHNCKGCTDETARHMCDCLDYCPDDKGVDCPICLSATYSHKCRDRSEALDDMITAYFIDSTHKPTGKDIRARIKSFRTLGDFASISNEQAEEVARAYEEQVDDKG